MKKIKSFLYAYYPLGLVLTLIILGFMFNGFAIFLACVNLVIVAYLVISRLGYFFDDDSELIQSIKERKANPSIYFSFTILFLLVCTVFSLMNVPAVLDRLTGPTDSNEATVTESYDEGYSDGYWDGYDEGYDDSHDENHIDIYELEQDAVHFVVEQGGWHPEEALCIVETYQNNEPFGKSIPTEKEYLEAISSLCDFYDYFYSRKYEKNYP